MRHFITALMIVAATPALAGMDHSKHHTAPKISGKVAKNKAVKEYLKANKAMHKGMDICFSGNADVDFVEGMIPHHQGAVDMANVVLKYGKDETIRELAKRIIIAQESEIGMMKAWIAGRRSNWRAENVDSLESVKAFEAANATMHKNMNIKFTGDPDVDFARGMIPHHQGAIDMAWVLKRHGMDRRLRAFADDIITGQGQEIRLMEKWLASQREVDFQFTH